MMTYAEPRAPLPRRRLWPVFVPSALLLLAAIGWSGFWFYASHEVDAQFKGWQAREAKSGRVYDCARRTVAGFPFRLEVRCDGASVSLLSQTAGQAAGAPPVTFNLGEILVVAQVYDPKLVIAEFTAPATLSDRGGPPSMSVNWKLARASVVGLPAVPQRASIVFDDPEVDRVNGSMLAPLARAQAHARAPARPVRAPEPFAQGARVARRRGALERAHAPRRLRRPGPPPRPRSRRVHHHHVGDQPRRARHRARRAHLRDRALLRRDAHRGPARARGAHPGLLARGRRRPPRRRNGRAHRAWDGPRTRVWQPSPQEGPSAASRRRRSTSDHTHAHTATTSPSGTRTASAITATPAATSRMWPASWRARANVKP